MANQYPQGAGLPSVTVASQRMKPVGANLLDQEDIPYPVPAPANDIEVTDDITLQDSNFPCHLFVTGTVAITLPEASKKVGMMIWLKDAAVVTIAVQGSDTNNGLSTPMTYTQTGVLRAVGVKSTTEAGVYLTNPGVAA